MALVLRDCFSGNYAHPITITPKWECTLPMRQTELLDQYRQEISFAKNDNDRSSHRAVTSIAEWNDRDDVSIYRRFIGCRSKC